MFHVWREGEDSSFFEEAHGGAYTSGKVWKEFAIVAEAAEQAAELFDVRGHWHLCKGGNFVVTNVVGGDSVT